MDDLKALHLLGKKVKSHIRTIGENDRIEFEDGTIIIAMCYGGLAWFELEKEGEAK